MSEYIEREALIAELAECTIISDDLYGMGIMAGIGAAMKKVSGVPAADVAPVRHGRWRPYPDCGVTRCSVCDWSIEECIDYKYCPNCGADMRGGDEDG